jgi:hypothetical protein
MATKKQKREVAEAKRKAFEEQVKADGLRAQKADQERRRKQNEQLKEEASREIRRLNDIVRSAGVV